MKHMGQYVIEQNKNYSQDNSNKDGLVWVSSK